MVASPAQSASEVRFMIFLSGLLQGYGSACASLSPAERSGRLVGRCAAIDLDKLRRSISSQSSGPGVDFSSGLALENFEG
jgi:hypothetical protein